MISEPDRQPSAAIINGTGAGVTARLLRLCGKADRVNLERIRAGFPDEVEAYEAWRDGKETK